MLYGPLGYLRSRRQEHTGGAAVSRARRDHPGCRSPPLRPDAQLRRYGGPGSGPGRCRLPERLLHNGHVLTLSALVTLRRSGVALLGKLATSLYSTASVGRSYAALSAATLLAGIGQLNLADVLVRFVPGRRSAHTRRLALRCYTAAALFSTAVAVVFLAIVPVFSPELDYLRSPVTAVAFVAATGGYSIFVLQDGLRLGPGCAGRNWVLGENAVFASVKVLLLLGCGLVAVGSGILLSWAGALALSPC